MFVPFFEFSSSYFSPFSLLALRFSIWSIIRQDKNSLNLQMKTLTTTRCSVQKINLVLSSNESYAGCHLIAHNTTDALIIFKKILSRVKANCNDLLIWCLRSRQHRKGNWLGRLRMANEIQCKIPYIRHQHSKTPRRNSANILVTKLHRRTLLQKLVNLVSNNCTINWYIHINY